MTTSKLTDMCASVFKAAVMTVNHQQRADNVYAKCVDHSRRQLSPDFAVPVTSTEL